MGCNPVKLFLSADGGGTKTEFLLIDQSGAVLATRRQGSAYYLEIGMEGLRSMLSTSAPYCGGLLQTDSLLLPLFEAALHGTERRYDLKAPRLRPAAGAAVTAARLSGAPLAPSVILRLAKDHASGVLP